MSVMPDPKTAARHLDYDVLDRTADGYELRRLHWRSGLQTEYYVIIRPDGLTASSIWPGGRYGEQLAREQLARLAEFEVPA